jgi:DNA polymerase-4
MFPSPDTPGAPPPVPTRKIIHVDMDAFYASVEQRDDPRLRGRPVAVGGSRERGVVAAASYEARRFGVRSAMPSVTARRLCPSLVFVPPRFDVYRGVSEQIHGVFSEYTPIVEPLSLDEAYLDVTSNLKGIPLASQVAREVRARILEETGLTASAGVSYCKFLAKVASGYRKPNGQTVIPPERGPAFVEGLDIARFHGIGPVTAERMARLGILTGADLKARDLAFLQAEFGKAGAHYHAIARGIDDRPVNPDRERKSIGAETTFARDLWSYEELARELGPRVDKVWASSLAKGVRGRTVTLKVKYADFRQITRARSGAEVASHAELSAAGLAILSDLCPMPAAVRLLGISLSSFEDGEAEPGPQLRLAL